MRQYRTDGIVLSQKNMFESDKVICIFSLEKGKIQLLARGANSGKARYGGRIDVLNHTQFWVYKGKSFDYISECEVLTSFSNIRKDYDRITWALYFLDILKKATSFGQHNQGLFNLILNALAYLDKGVDLMALKAKFHEAFLKVEGLWDDGCSNLSDTEFQTKFGDYSGRVIKTPERLCG
ncbi:MAG: DNA repair protein RecO [Candidatus Margulisbacteria bacterium]|nr:DNA repair protein RecO [Candidatus Margulisiibacteriota bacterium]